MTTTPKASSGFTMVELMVTLAVVAILAAVAVPSYRDTIRRNQVSAASNALLADLNYARTEAINRGVSVSLCPSSDGSTCAVGSTAWDTGWLVYTYQPGAAKANTAYAAGDLLLRASGGRPAVVIQTGSADVLSFGSQGQLIPSALRQFRTCIRAGSGSGGESPATALGMQMDLNGSGSIVGKRMAAEASCTPG